MNLLVSFYELYIIFGPALSDLSLMPYIIRTTVGYKCLICSCYRVFFLALSICSIQGLFILQFTDLHASNIFVDADWNITGIIDLDFICSLPPDMLCMPSWLCIDDLDDISRNRDEFAASYDSFLQTFAAAEKKQQHHSTLLADTMRQAWHSGAYWVYYSFISVNAMAIMVSDHIFPIFGFESTLDEEEAFFRSLSHFWCRNSEQFVQRKMKEKVQYDLDLQNYFDTAKLTG